MRRGDWVHQRNIKRRDLVAEAAQLFDRSILATMAEARGSLIVNRCVYPIKGVEGQSTCDLPVDGKALIDQMEALPPDAASASHLFHCCVHHEKAAFKAAGVDVGRIYEASPYFQELKALSPT